MKRLFVLVITLLLVMVWAPASAVFVTNKTVTLGFIKPSVPVPAGYTLKTIWKGKTINPGGKVTYVIPNPTHEPVKVDLYYEAMCPFCSEFIVEQLYPTWSELGDIMEVGLFPFGNAKYEPAEPGWTFTCQHGPDECKANMIQACAQDYFRKNIQLEMEFVNCMESAEQPAQAGANCSLSVGVDWAPIERCINSLDGQILLHDVALKQEKLQPKVKYVPWVLVNDKWSEEMEDACTTNLKKVVCETYSGTRPECNEILQPKQLKTIKRTYP